MSSVIQKLPDTLINQIAAGEVIENPASVVKELVENAIDAKSTSIEIQIFGGGLQGIIISDNGVGMNEEDAKLCFERHATSKLKSFEDLWSLTTMGFRGEALAAISSIAKVTLLTSIQTPFATKVVAEGGKILFVEKSSRQKGTTIEVRDLFYNIPARKSFQKTSSASFSQIYKLIQQFSLAYPEIEFSLFQAEQKALSIPASPKEISFLEQLKEKACLFLEEQIDSLFLPLEIHKEHYSIAGWLGKPEITRHNRGGQQLFINKRAVQCSFIQAILKQAYGTLIDPKKYPVCILHLQIDPDKIDINVHPQKKEIRFKEDWKIEKELYDDFKSSLFGPIQVQPLEEALSSSFAYNTYVPSSAFSSSFKSLKNHTSFDAPWSKINSPSIVTSFADPRAKEESASIEHPLLPMEKVHKIFPIGIFDHHLLLNAENSELPLGITTERGIFFVDLKKLYEKKMILSITSKNPKKERLLLPIPISLKTPIEEALLQKMEEFGFSARILGKTSLALEAIPQGISMEIAEDLFVFLLERVSDRASTSSIEQKLFTAYDGKLNNGKKFTMAEALTLWQWTLLLPFNEGKELWKAAISFLPEKKIENPLSGGSFERIF